MAFSNTTECDLHGFRKKLDEYAEWELQRLCKYFHADIIYVIANVDFIGILQELCDRTALPPEDFQNFKDLEKRFGSDGAASRLVDNIFTNGRERVLHLWETLFALSKRCSHPNLLQILDEIIYNGHNVLSEEFPNEVDPEMKDLQASQKQKLYHQTCTLSEYTTPGNSRGSQNYPISERYVELVVISERQYRNRTRHEMLEAGELHEHHIKQKLQTGLERITPDRLFRWCRRSHRMPQSVIVTGVAGVGKSTLLQKFVNDWVQGRHYQKFSFVFFFKLKNINVLPEQMNLEQLILNEYPYLRDKLEKIFQEPPKLLFIFDGLDESRKTVDLSIGSSFLCSRPSDVRDISVIVSSLVKQTLLPGSYVLMTSRPKCLVKLEASVLHRTAEIVGFLSKERENYFSKFYGDENISREAFNYVKNTEILYTLCYNPSYCWITCTALRPCFTKQTDRPLVPPKTVTQLFVYFISNILMNHTVQCQSIREDMLKVANLADYGVKNQIFLYHDEDLKIPTKLYSSFMVESIQSGSQTAHEFLHLTIQEFLAALMYYVDFSEDGFRQLLHRASTCNEGYYDIIFTFLAGLSHPPSRSFLEKHLGKFSADATCKVISWLGEKVSEELEIARNSKDKRKILNVFTFLFESQNSTLVHEKVGQNASLNFFDFYLTPLDCIILSYILDCCKKMGIESLNLDSCLIQTEGLEKLGPVLHNVKDLRLANNDLRDAGIPTICSALKHPNCRIESLRLKNNIFTEKCCEALASAIKENGTLRHLNLGKNKIRDEGLAKLLSAFGHGDCRLETLSLAENGLTDVSCEKLLCLENCGTLQKLDLSGNLLRDDCAKDIEKLISTCTSLTDIRLGINDISTTTERKLESLRESRPRLRIDMGMPSCFVSSCGNSTRYGTTYKPQGTIFHCFPKKRELVVVWLRCCGVDEEEMDSRTTAVMEDKRADKFRICSQHFSDDQYESTSGQTQPSRRRLILGAVPNLNVGPMGSSAPVPLLPMKNHFVSCETQTFCSFLTMVTVACQTDFSSVDSACQTEPKCALEETEKSEKSDAYAQWPEYEYNYFGEMGKVTQDHTYTRARTESSPPNFLPPYESTPVKVPFLKFVEAIEGENIPFEEPKDLLEETCMEESFESIQDDKKKDPDFKETSRADSDSFCEGEGVTNEFAEIVCEKKYLVFRSCLLSLLRMVCCSFLVKDTICQECVDKGKPLYRKCGKPLVNFTTNEIGSCLHVNGQCFDNHDGISWSSQPMVGRVSAGNLLIASSILFSGMTYEKAASFAGFLGLEFIGSSTFYLYQKRYLFPTIHEAWLHEQMELDIRFSNVELKVSGDGQCDSPGFSAKYLVYTIMEQITQKILSIIVVQVTECTSSVAMEKHALVISLQALRRRGFKIDVLTTDRHISIAKIMRENYTEINHQFDVWHVAKSIKKKLNEASKKKGCTEITAWSQSITNHLWWASRTCEKSATLLQEKWMSLLNHITNKHHWNGYNQFHQCEHDPIPKAIQRKKKWLRAETAAHDAIVKIVTDRTLKRDLRGLSEFTHTGALEVFHSMVLKFRPKQQHFSFDGMEARSRLAALAHNSNTGRSQARIKAGRSDDESEGELRYKLEFPKNKKDWVAKNVFEGMQYGHVYDMMVHVLEMKHHDLLTEWQSRADELPENIARVKKPEKAEVVARMSSRF